MSTATITATNIQDPSGQLLANATWNLNFVPTYGFPQASFNDGGASFTKQFSGTLDAVGSFSFAGVTRNDTISPAGSQWEFIIKPQASDGGFTVRFSVTSDPFDITAIVNAVITTLIIRPSNVNTAYKDAEVVGIVPGQLYFDLTLGLLKVWNGSAWVSFPGLVAVSANKVLAGPTSGPNALPTFRLLTAADIPTLLNTLQQFGSVNTGLSEISAGVLGVGTGASGATDGKLMAADLIPGASAQMQLQQDTGRFGTQAIRAQAIGVNIPGAFTVMPSGTSTESLYRLYNASDPANVGFVDFDLNGLTLTMTPAKVGTGILPTTLDMSAFTAKISVINNGTNLTVPATGANLISDAATQVLQNKTIDTLTNILKLGSIRFAENFGGADLGAKINAAVTDLGGNPGEVWVSKNAGTTISTAVAIGSNQCLRFIEGGVYTLNAKITLGQAASIEGAATGSTVRSVTLQAGVASNLPIMVEMTIGQCALRYIELDGNKANNPTAGVGVKITTAPRCEIVNSMIYQCKSHGLWIHGTTGTDASGFKMFGTIILQCDGDGIYCEKTADCFIESGCELESCGLQSGALPTVNTNGTTITWVSGPKWSTDSSLVGVHVIINGIVFTVATIPSTTSFTITSSAGVLSGVTLQWGSGIELNNGNAWRIIGNDFGQNSCCGIDIYGTNSTNESSNNIIEGNQFANIGPDILILGHDGTSYVARYTSIVGNQFVGNTALFGPANTYNSLQIQDAGGEVISGNYFAAQQGASPVRARGILTTESVSGRDQQKTVVGNQFTGTWGTQPVLFNTTKNGLSANAGGSNNPILIYEEGPKAAVVGTGADVTMYTVTLPAYQIASSRGIIIEWQTEKTTGSGSVTYKTSVGGSVIDSFSLTQNSAISDDNHEYKFFNDSGSAVTQHWSRKSMFVVGASVSFGASSGTGAVNTLNSVTVAIIMNALATQQVTPKQLLIYTF